MPSHAQTNVQLYNQMETAGYALTDRRLARQAYELGMTLFSGRYHPCGKPLLAHVVGAASILVEERLPGPLVAATLVHAAYTHGDFGAGPGRHGAGAREEIRRALGVEVEALAWGYHHRPFWGSPRFDALLADPSACADNERKLARMHLADVLDDYLDRATLYCPSFELAPWLEADGGASAAQLAERLGHPRLAAALRAAVGDVVGDAVPEALRRDTRYAVTLAPRSLRAGAAWGRRLVGRWTRLSQRRSAP